MLQTILLVEDNDLIRAGLVSVLERLHAGAVAISESRTLQQALQRYEEAKQFDLVILDLNLPDAKGLAGLRSFKTRFPSARIVVASGSYNDMISAEAYALGASAYLQKSVEIDALGSAILDQLSGKSSPADNPLPIVNLDSLESRRRSLSPVESEVLALVLHGHSNQEIAEATQLKLGTVKNYVSVLCTIFGVTSRAKLTSLFLQG